MKTKQQGITLVIPFSAMRLATAIFERGSLRIYVHDLQWKRK